ncbi:MAG: efflux RND transporter periplasmic adaptor subunit [Nitrospirae bacterium]|nr:efflux RND transporter periplasmic adaptor subunit [Nitrospirota bacterium]
MSGLAGRQARVVCRVMMLGAFLATSGCGGKSGGNAATPPPENHVSVEVITARPAPFTEHYQIPAVAEPVQAFHLGVEVGGTLAELAVDVGDRVKAGDVLARLDGEPLALARDSARAALERAQVRVALARKAYARQRSLRAEGSVAESALEDAELAVRLALADRRLAGIALAEAERNLRLATVAAPADAEVTARFAELGAVLAPGAPLFNLARTDRIRLVAGLSEAEVVHVAEGAGAKVRFDALPEQVFGGSVVRVGSVDGAGGATFPVEIRVDNPDGRIRPGMVARISLPGRKVANAVPVPAVALRRDGDTVVVFTAVEGAARPLPVRVAALVDETAWIDRGLAAGTPVVVVGQSTLKGGDKVAVTRIDGREAGADRQAPAVYGLP